MSLLRWIRRPSAGARCDTCGDFMEPRTPRLHAKDDAGHTVRVCWNCAGKWFPEAGQLTETSA